ncbi:hypothetical protein WS105_0548 [Weissella ceti]|uniref:hypothetical protein n=1 Tax=Weissella ceti TaxID=759620 RepID=UPI0004F69DF0|nr:hypothetical protein [Weissella ceti]AIM64138.1 hypothetical protein WS105_0548 [Weissella ceti]
MKKMITIICTGIALPIVSVIICILVYANFSQYFMYYTVQKYGETDYYNVLNTDLRTTTTNSLSETSEFKLSGIGTRHPSKILAYKVEAKNSWRDVEDITLHADASYEVYDKSGISAYFYDKKEPQNKYRFVLSLIIHG